MNIWTDGEHAKEFLKLFWEWQRKKKRKNSANKFVVRINGPPCLYSNISECQDFMHTFYMNTSDVYDRIGRFIRFITNSVAYDWLREQTLEQNTERKRKTAKTNTKRFGSEWEKISGIPFRFDAVFFFYLFLISTKREWSQFVLNSVYPSHLIGRVAHSLWCRQRRLQILFMRPLGMSVFMCLVHTS